MGLFKKKPKPRFETITIDREREVFRALEDKGWILCDQPFQIEIQKPAEKLRKDAMAIAKDLKGELIVEVFDPIFTNMPWRGLRYAVWRRATPMEIQERMRKKQAQGRPDYKDSMGSIEDIEKKLDEKKIKVSEEDLHALDSMVNAGPGNEKQELDQKTKEELIEAENALKAISTFDPYNHQGEEGTVDELVGGGPVFQESIQLETDADIEKDNVEVGEIDAMSMMMDAAKDTSVVETPPPSPPAQPPSASPPTQQPSPSPPTQQPSPSPPARVPEAKQLPQEAAAPQPPKVASPPQPPAESSSGGALQRTPPPIPPANTLSTPPPVPKPPAPKEDQEKEQGK